MLILFIIKRNNIEKECYRDDTNKNNVKIKKTEIAELPCQIACVVVERIIFSNLQC